ncbi:hypothetical protein EVAR_35477_1 [Eumeta japonica]|uniref:DDE Tnp4 domain-containing protein n=1 Tax=Eumeta variegata TaxID=151549 RepID=A0A4C1XJQ1_EUMVA|nr:hypothetical protein EVAR_35477_1 [Eumeta japonica]
MTPKKIDPITLAACALHNWLRKTSDMYITQRCVDFEDIQQGVVVPGAWRAQMRQVLEGLSPTRYNNHAFRRAEAIRNTYAQLFETIEAVPRQGLDQSSQHSDVSLQRPENSTTPENVMSPPSTIPEDRPQSRSSSQSSVTSTT